MRKKNIPFTEETRQGLESHVKALREQRIKADNHHLKAGENPIDVGALLRSHGEMINELYKNQETKKTIEKKGGHAKAGTKAKKITALENAILKFIKGNLKAFNETLKSDSARIRELQKDESFKNYDDQKLRRAIVSLRNIDKLK